MREEATRAWSPRGTWHAPNGRLLARAFCYILEERGSGGELCWRGVCHLHPTTPQTRIPLGPGRFVLALEDGRRADLEARVTIEGDSGSIRATFKDVVPPDAANGCASPGPGSGHAKPPSRSAAPDF